MKILVTGGAGFIGSHLVAALVAAGHDVTVADRLLEEVHGPFQAAYRLQCDRAKAGGYSFRPGLASHAVEIGPVRYDVLFHLAAAVGVGQAAYQPDRYHRLNGYDTSRALRWYVDNPDLRPGRIVVASSMSVYGEGARYWIGQGAPAPTPETHPAAVPNHYALTKFDQERQVLHFGRDYGVPAVALRFFNVYGEGQSLSNPYTGVAAMFAAQLLQGKGGLVYEDGLQTRDFVHVSDVVQALLLAMEAEPGAVAGEAINVGTGEATTLLELHAGLAAALGADALAPVVTGVKRAGDVRHCFADIGKARERLGYRPKVALRDGLAGYAAWLKGQDLTAVRERVAAAWEELAERGLVRL